jgi:hypothetical protein
MARKIIIDFTSTPVLGKAFEYTIFINGVSLVYQNAKNTIVANYVSGADTDNNINLDPLNDPIDYTLNWLTSRYISASVIYSRTNDTIEVLINSNEYVTINFGTSNINIETTSEAVVENGVGLRYYFQYKNIVGDDYLCQIAKKNYTGIVTEIFGTAIINKGSVKDHLEPIRGGGISLKLEASTEVTLEDLYSEDEQDFTVKLYRNNKLIFSGYLNPEGVFQSFVEDLWIISLDCVDGLGSLANLSFVDPLGFPFLNKMKGIDIVYYALNRSGIILPINVSINTTYEGLTIDADTEILSKIYLNANRFQKTDGDTIMSCEEVLKSVLDLYCACITQIDGEWYIYKPNELFQDRNVIFKIYDINNVFLGRKTVKMDKVLGSQINGFYPHHCNADQKIQIKGSNSAFRINYKYGFVASLLSNPNLLHSGLSYTDWSINPAGYSRLVNDPTDVNGFKTIPFVGASSYTLLATSENVPLNANDLIELKVNLTSNGGGAIFAFKVRNGSSYLKLDGTWTTDSGDASFLQFFNGNPNVSYPNPITSTFSVLSTFLPNTDNTFIEVYVPVTSGSSGATISEINSIDMVNRFEGNNIVGEFHTASRASRVSSNIKENKTIYNGDNNGIVYLGAIFKEDQVTPTTVWNRKNSFELSPILKIASEEELRISQRPLKMFDGSTYGQLPYLSVISINGLDGVYMPIEYSYDTMRNVAKMKLLELFCPEISDLVYKFTYDYGNVVRPTIQG